MFAPLAEILTVLPIQILEVFEVSTMLGSDNTSTVCVVEFEQPVVLNVPDTEYTVNAVGETLMLDDVAAVF